MNTPTVSITTDEISVTYNNGHTAIHDVSISLGAGKTCALVGVNGSGKSTLFKSIMGLVKPQTGSIRLGGLPVKEALKRSLVAYVPQSEDIDWDFPILVRDVVMQGRYGFMGFFRRASDEDHRAVDDAMARLGISDLGKRQIGELSGGQKKRVFLARALAQQSKIILLDEPFTGVDVKTENAIMELLQELQDEGYLMLVSTHNLGTVPDYCNEVVLLNRTVIAAGSTETTYTQENLEKTFGGILKHIRLSGDELHDDADERTVTIITDDERPAVFYGKTKEDSPVKRNIEGGDA
ncbi:MAG: iron ABC transporter permease [Gammaproteobacteria bacterium]|nr:MAG: iron ABC transporter permease [Gammaproteobacteria bacterium]